MAVISIRDFTPPPRYDGLPWTTVRIEEAPATTGPWVIIETFPLSPLDPEPAHPLSRSITTELATLESGWYRLVFVDATGDISRPTTPIQNDAGVEGTVRPTVRELSALMRARTQGEFSNQGVFNANTTPTAAQVDELLDLATDHVLVKVGRSIPARFHRFARSAILYKAAALVEVTYYPEQAAGDNTAYERYQQQYRELLETLVEAIAGEDASTVGSGSGGFGAIVTPGHNGYYSPLYGTELLP